MFGIYGLGGLWVLFGLGFDVVLFVLLWVFVSMVMHLIVYYMGLVVGYVLLLWVMGLDALWLFALVLFVC